MATPALRVFPFDLANGTFPAEVTAAIDGRVDARAAAGRVFAAPDADGTIDSTAAFQAAVNAYPVIVLPANSVYRLGKISWTGASRSIVALGPVRIIQTNVNGVFDFKGEWDLIGTATSIASQTVNLVNAPEGSAVCTVSVLTMAAAATVTKGDALKVVSDDINPYGRPSLVPKMGEYSLAGLDSAASGTVTLSNVLVEPYATNIRVARPREQSYVIDGPITFDTDPSIRSTNAFASVINIHGGKFSRISGVKFLNAPGTAIINTGYKTTIRDVTFHNLDNRPSINHYGYGVQDGGWQTQMRGCDGQYLRHMYSEGNGTANFTATDYDRYGGGWYADVRNCSSSNTQGQAFDAHGTAYGTVFSDCHVFGSYVGAGTGGQSFVARGRFVKFINCVADQSFVGFQLSGTGAEAINCESRRTQYQALQIVGDNFDAVGITTVDGITVTGGLFENVGGNAPAAIGGDGYNVNARLKGVTLRMAGSISGARGIELQGTETLNVDLKDIDVDFEGFTGTGGVQGLLVRSDTVTLRGDGLNFRGGTAPFGGATVIASAGAAAGDGADVDVAGLKYKHSSVAPTMMAATIAKRRTAYKSKSGAGTTQNLSSRHQNLVAASGVALTAVAVTGDATLVVRFTGSAGDLTTGALPTFADGVQQGQIVFLVNATNGIVTIPATGVTPSATTPIPVGGVATFEYGGDYWAPLSSGGGGATSAQGAKADTAVQPAVMTTAINAAITGLLNGAPGALDTLQELAAALGNDASFATTVTNALAGKLAAGSNLSDLASASAARTNLGLGTAATKGTGTSSGTVAAGDDPRIVTAIPALPVLANVTAAAALTKGSTQPVDATAGAIAMTALPALSGLSVGDAYGLQKIDSTASPVSVAFTAGDTTTSGATSLALTLPGTATLVVANAASGGGKVWRVVNHVRGDAALDANYLRLGADQTLTNPQKVGLRTLLGAASATAGSLPVLAFAPAGWEQSASSRGHICADNADAATQTITYRTFYPLADASTRSLKLVFNNMHPGNASGTSIDAPNYNDLTVAACVEQPDGTKLPVKVGGSSSWTVPRDGSPVVSDEAVLTGQATATAPLASTTSSGVWVDTYVSVPAADSHTGCATTSGSSTITDASITSAHVGRAVTGTGIPVNSRVGAVVAGTSFTLMNAAGTLTVNASATGTGITLTLPNLIPLNLGSLFTRDGKTAGTTGANLTTIGSAVPTATMFTYYYGPALILAPATKSRMVVSVSDSIFDGYSEPSGTSGYDGPVARACRALGYGHIKASRGGESTVGFQNAILGRQIRATYLTGSTDAVIEYGTNDGQLASMTVSTGLLLESYLLNVVSYLLGIGVKRIAMATIPPRTTSTDSWATTANQTPLASAQISALAAINAWIRAKPAGVAAVIDLADSVMSAHDSGLWAPSSTSDGVHPSSALMVGDITTRTQTALASMGA